ncbi:MAG TPA: Hsp20/alpha crystallin family protein [Tepiditoga sp.]|nr:Hsp20/alpha crystallin family protein [Thermotogota bacterium]HOO74415.1 Hsp20/alpha crystallin family protein [Tepiditoga sp.]
MSLIKKTDDMFRSPFDVMQKEIDSLFDTFPFKDSFPSLGNIDYYETEKDVVVECELPGMDKKDIKININDNRLNIYAERSDKNEKKGKNYFRKERIYGKTERTVLLPEYADTDNVKASFENGVLELKVAKKEDYKKNSKQISIE